MNNNIFKLMIPFVSFVFVYLFVGSLLAGCTSCHKPSVEEGKVNFQPTDTAKIASVEEIPTKTPADSCIAWLYAYTYNGSNTQECRDVVQKLISLVPHESSIYYFAQAYLANTYFFEGNYQRMEQLLNEIEKEPELKKYPFEQVRLKYVRINMLAGLERTADVRKVCNEMLWIRPLTDEQSNGLKLVMDGILQQLVKSYLSTEETEEGYRYFAELQKTDNPMMSTLNRRGLAVITAYMAFRAGLFEEAGKRMDDALKLPHQGDNNGLARDYWYAGEIYSRIASRRKEAVDCWNKAIETVGEQDLYEVIPLAQASLGEYYYRTGNFEEAAQRQFEALRTQERLGKPGEITDAYRSIADLHTTWGFYDKAHHYLQLAAKTNHEKNDDSPLNKGQIQLACYRLCKAQHQADSCIYYLHQADSLFTMLNENLLLLETHAYLGLAKTETDATRNEGIRLLRQVVDDASATDLSMLQEVRSSLGMGLLRQGNEKEGLPLLLSAIKGLEREESGITLRSCYAFLAEYYMHKGNMHTAFDIRSRQQILADTLFSREKVRAVAIARVGYETEKKEQQNKLLQTELELKHRSLIYYFLTVVLLALLLIGYIVYNRNLRRKNIILARQLEQLSEKPAPRPASQPSTPLYSLFSRLEILMNEKKPYLDCELTRKTLADQVGTNERYLADAIREYTDGKTFLEYVNAFRLEHSRVLLVAHSDINIETLCSSSGFNSRQTFYRMFKKEFGLTPTEYRRYSSPNKTDSI